MNGDAVFFDDLHQNALQTYFASLNTASFGSSDMTAAFHKAAQFFAAQRTAQRGARGIIVFATGVDDGLSSDVSAACAHLQHDGFHISAVIPAIASDYAETSSWTGSDTIMLHSLRRAVSGLVSAPPARNVLVAHTATGVEGAMMDLALPHMQSPVTSVSPSAVSLPFDPRSIDACVSPHTCFVAAGGWVRAFTGESYQVRQHGEFVIASYRTPTHGTVDVLGGLGKCPHTDDDAGLCLTKVTIVPHDASDDFVTIRATPNGASVSEGLGGYTSLFADDAAAPLPTTTTRLVQVVHSRVAPTWRSTAGARASGNTSAAVYPVSSFAISIRDAMGTGSARVHVEVDAGVLTIALIVGADATPTRPGLCGVPAGAAGEDAAPADRQPRHVRYVGSGADADGLEVPPTPPGGEYAGVLSTAHAGATSRRRCPPASEAYRLLDESEDGIERLHAHSRLTDADFAHLDTLERVARDTSGSGGGRSSFVARTPSRIYGSYRRGSKTHPSPKGDCKRAFGTDAHLGKMCQSIADTTARSGVYTALRTAVTLCRIRCLAPDAARAATYSVVSGVSGSGVQRATAAGTEILDDLVAPGWCEENVCELLTPRLPDTSPTYDMGPRHGGAPFQPTWFLLSKRNPLPTAPYVDDLAVVHYSGTKALFTPPQGGNYTFSAYVRGESSDCAAHLTNVSINVRCPRVLDSPYAGPNVTVERVAGSFPFVSLLGEAPVLSGVAVPPKLDVWWNVEAFPESPVASYSGAPLWTSYAGQTIVFPRTSAAMFQPPHAGEWVLSYSVFDGCAVRTAFVTVTALCGKDCKPTARVLHAPTAVISARRTVPGVDLEVSFSLAADGTYDTMGGNMATRFFNVTFAKLPYVPVSNTPAVVTRTDAPVPGSSSETLMLEGATTPATASERLARFLAWRTHHTENPAVGGKRVTVASTGASGASGTTVSTTDGPVGVATQCGLADDASSPYTLSGGSGSVAVSVQGVWPQYDSKSFDYRRYAGARGEDDLEDLLYEALPDVCAAAAAEYKVAAAFTSGKLPIYAVSNMRNMSGNRKGVVFSSYNAAQSPSCGFGSTMKGAMWLHTTRQPTTYTLSVNFRVPSYPTNPSYNDTGDGRAIGSIRAEYRMLTTAAAAADAWNSTDVSDASGTWTSTHSQEFDTAHSGESYFALIPGPSVVRLVVEMYAHRVRHLIVTGFEIASELNTDASRCHRAHMRGKLQATDGCSVAEDTFETSFGCPLPPHVALVTPHYEVEFDYENGAFPSVPLVGFLTELDGVTRQLGLVDLSGPSPSSEWELAAYANVPGYAHAELSQPVLATTKSVVMSAASTATPCTGSSFSTSPWIFESSHSLPASGVRSYSVTTAASHGAGPTRISPAGTNAFVVFPECYGTGTHTAFVYLDVPYDSNATHLNVTFYTHAVNMPSWTVVAGSYAATSASGMLPGSESVRTVYSSAGGAPGDAWTLRSLIVPVVGRTPGRLGVSRYVWFAVSFDRSTAGYTTGDAVVRSYFALGGPIKAAPAFLTKTAMINTFGDGIIRSEGVARFAVTQATGCHLVSAFADVKAVCKYALGDQKLSVYHSSSALGTVAVPVASTADAAVGTKTIRGDPTGPVTVTAVIPDGVAVGARGALWSGRAHGVVRRGAVDVTPLGDAADMTTTTQYTRFASYGAGSNKPWDGTAITSADLLEGLVGVGVTSVTTAGAGEVELRVTDGCRTNTQRTAVTFVCSDTTWTGATASPTVAGGAVPAGGVPSGAVFAVTFQPNAQWAAPQADGTVATTRTSVDAHVRRKVEIVSITPATGATLVVSKDSSDSGRVAGLNAAGAANAWAYDASQTAAYKVTGEGSVRVRVSYSLLHDCSAPTAPVEFDVAVGAASACLPITVAVASAAGATKFVKRVDVTFVSYTAADFTAVGNAKNKDAIVGYLNGASSPLGAHATVADAEYTTMLQLKLAFKDSATDFATVGDFIKKDLAFQRLFGEVSSVAAKATTQGAVAATYTFTGTGTAPTLASLTFQTVGLSFADITICSGNCPAFSGTTLTVPVDLFAHAQYPNAPATGRLWTGAIVPTWASPAQPTTACNAATPLIDACSFMSNTAIAPRGAVGLVDGPAVADATATPAAPGRIVYAKDEPRAFQRVYLVDATALPDHSYLGAQNLAAGTTAGYTPPTFEYEWWVAEAPAASIYAPVWGNGSATKADYTTSDMLNLYYVSDYPTVTATSPVSAYIVDEGSLSVAARHAVSAIGAGSDAFTASFHRIGNTAADCLRSSAIPRNPRGEACWTPDVPGAYKLFYRARMTSCAARLGGDADGWMSDTIAFNAECPAFAAAFTGEATTSATIQLGGPSPSINFGLSLAGSALVDHIRPVWTVKHPENCEYSITDESDTNVTISFHCPGTWNVSAVVTDGCTLKTLTRIVEVGCATDAIARHAPNRTISFNVPEAGDVGTFATMEFGFLTGDAMAALAAAAGICPSSIQMYGWISDYVPHSDTDVLSNQTYKASRASGSDALLTGAAADLRRAGRTTDGDVLATIMAFAIGAAVLVAVGITVALFAMGPGAAVAPMSGVGATGNPGPADMPEVSSPVSMYGSGMDYAKRA